MNAAATTRHLLDQLAETADHDAKAAARKAERRAQSLTELRALIEVALEDLVATLDVVRDLVDSRRPGVNIGGGGGGKVTGSPAPISVPALSVLEETDQYLDDVCNRLTRHLELAGTDWAGTDWAGAGRQLVAKVALIDNPDRLQPIHRTLEQLAEQAHRVVDGVRRLPAPCPHCRRQTLLVDHDTGVTVCGKNPKTNRHEPCRCTDRYCPCQHDRTYRHKWSRGDRAHRPTSWQGLNRAQKEALVLEAAITRVRDLHTKTAIHPWADDCPPDHEVETTDNGIICLTCAPLSDSCRHCLAMYGDPDQADWPCATIRALDDLPTPPTPGEPS